MHQAPFPAATESNRSGIRRVVIVKENPLLAQAIGDACATTLPDWAMRRHIRSVEALSALRRESADLLVCGMNLPDFDGLDLLEAARRERLAARFMVVSDRKDERTLHVLLQTRPVEVMVDVERIDGGELRRAILDATKAGRRVSPTLRTAWAAVRGETDGYSLRLTDAEQDVLSLLGAGDDDERIAVHRHTSGATVQTQRKRIMRKLNLHSRSELVVYAVRRGLARFTPRRVLRPGFEWKELAASASCA